MHFSRVKGFIFLGKKHDIYCVCKKTTLDKDHVSFPVQEFKHIKLY